jgi:hypothetical protein
MLRRNLENMAFADVTEQDRDILAEIWEPARGEYLSMYLDGVTGFALDYWSATQLGEVWAMSQMEKGVFVSMLAFEESLRPPSRHVELLEAVDSFISSGEKLQVKDPIIVGLFQQHRPVLIDGYFRGTVFMRCAEANDIIPVLVPVASGATQ